MMQRKQFHESKKSCNLTGIKYIISSLSNVMYQANQISEPRNTPTYLPARDISKSYYSVFLPSDIVTISIIVYHCQPAVILGNLALRTSTPTLSEQLSALTLIVRQSSFLELIPRIAPMRVRLLFIGYPMNCSQIDWCA